MDIVTRWEAVGGEASYVRLAMDWESRATMFGDAVTQAAIRLQCRSMYGRFVEFGRSRIRQAKTRKLGVTPLLVTRQVDNNLRSQKAGTKGADIMIAPISALSREFSVLDERTLVPSAMP